jgi:hypothetical protein
MLVALLQIEPGTYREELKEVAVNLSCITRFKAATWTCVISGMWCRNARQWNAKLDYIMWCSHRWKRLCVTVYQRALASPSTFVWHNCLWTNRSNESTFNYPRSAKHYTGVLYIYNITPPPWRQPFGLFVVKILTAMIIRFTKSFSPFVCTSTIRNIKTNLLVHNNLYCKTM